MKCAWIYRLYFIVISIDAYLLMGLIVGGDLKSFLVQEAGLEPKDQRHLFRGKRMEDRFLQQVGVKDRSNSLHFEEMATKERKIEGAGKSHEISKPWKAVAEIRTEIDELLEKVILLVLYSHLMLDHGY